MNEEEPISKRELFLMNEAMKVADCYDTAETWVNEVISDSGETVGMHLDHDSKNLCDIRGYE